MININSTLIFLVLPKPSKDIFSYEICFVNVSKGVLRGGEGGGDQECIIQFFLMEVNMGCRGYILTSTHPVRSSFISDNNGVNLGTDCTAAHTSLKMEYTLTLPGLVKNTVLTPQMTVDFYITKLDTGYLISLL